MTEKKFAKLFERLEKQGDTAAVRMSLSDNVMEFDESQIRALKELHDELSNPKMAVDDPYYLVCMALSAGEGLHLVVQAKSLKDLVKVRLRPVVIKMLGRDWVEEAAIQHIFKLPIDGDGRRLRDLESNKTRDWWTGE